MTTTAPRVLVVDDRLEMAETLADGLAERGFDPVALALAHEAVARLESERVDAVVTDLRMPDMDGLELLAVSRRLDPARPVIVMTAYGAIDTAIESIRRGAYHYLTKPFRQEELVIFLGRALDESRVRREAAALRATLQERFSPAGFVARSAALRAALDVVERIAPTDVPVLITGETGTGKGLIARTLHALSPRSGARFVTVNCAALPEALLESELFGHVKGAFTGATQDRPGLFAEAEGGTLLLDEIGEMPVALQAKLLHVLESGAVRAVGASRERHVDVRIVAATHRDLRRRVREGTFREDLLYRLDVVPVNLPPLRERQEDIPPLVDRFLAAARARYPTAVVERFSPEALGRLLEHGWPGNVRELAHVVERTVLLCRRPEVSAADLPPLEDDRGRPVGPLGGAGDAVLPVRELQRRYARWALGRCGGQRGRTAERLGIDPKTLAKWLDEATEGDPSGGETAA
ncbi:MAG TPA: sigma-54 dependent transcriptional regulator [Anaeromyxobacteraceae bacterium]|nr:sigma-54 dependent transcriptional regulator [Anaeromyxobacteraceae bacterium]